MTKQLKADIALLLVTIVWGTSFILMKLSTDSIPPFTFLAYRYAIAVIALILIFPKTIKNIDFKTIKYGFLIGLTMFGGCAFQIVGLVLTSASKSGFITGLSVILVPLFLAFKYKKLPSLSTIIGIAISFTGLVLLTLDSSLTINIGDILTFFCTVFFAFQIILISRYSPGMDSIALTFSAMLTVSVLSFIPGIINENLNAAFTTQSIIGLLFTALFCSTLAYSVQMSVQRHTSPTHAALIFMGEPVFSLFFAYILGGETLTLKAIIGCIFVLSGMLLSEIKIKWTSKD